MSRPGHWSTPKDHASHPATTAGPQACPGAPEHLVEVLHVTSVDDATRQVEVLAREAHYLAAGYDHRVHSIRSGAGAIPYPRPEGEPGSKRRSAPAR